MGPTIKNGIHESGMLPALGAVPEQGESGAGSSASEVNPERAATHQDFPLQPAPMAPLGDLPLEQSRDRTLKNAFDQVKVIDG